jgi:hypothetical protein
MCIPLAGGEINAWMQGEAELGCRADGEIEWGALVRWAMQM